MGIPTYTRYLLKSYKNLSIKKINNIDNIFLDFNAFIHPIAHDVFKKHPSSSKLFIENKIIDECYKKVIELQLLLNPKNLTYISIDGIAPFAKIHQQRSRRFKSIQETEFDKNAITAGTKFMKKLSNFLKEKFINNDKIIIDDDKNIGEGEHKILQYLRTNDLKSQVNVLCSLDADFFMLGIILFIQGFSDNLYLFREEQDEDMIKLYTKQHFIDINNFYETIILDNKHNYNFDNISFMRDYIFLCFLMGNDFIPHLYLFEIRFKGIQEILKIYLNFIDIYKIYLTNENEIIFSNVKKFFQFLLIKENSLIEKINYGMKKWHPKTTFKNNEEKKKYNEELLYPVYTPINYSNKSWKKQYYEKLFKTDYSYTRDIQNISENYLKMLSWNFNYYFGINNFSWRYYYKYEYSPLLNELINNITTEKYLFDNEKIDSNLQLLSILPEKSLNLLPKKCREVYKNKDLNYLFVKNGFNDISFCNMKWQSKIIFYPLDLNLIEQFL